MRNEIAATIAAAAVVLLTSSTAARTPRPQDQQEPQQQQQRPVPIFRSGADVVRLDVSVLDAHRKPVRGLKPEDFFVKEDGKVQQIVAFSDVNVPTGRVSPVWERGTEADVATNQLGEHRLFAIVLDTGVKPSNAPRTGMFDKPQNPAIAKGLREIVQSIVDRMGPDDVAAITGATCFQPFTSDRVALENAIEEIDPFGAPCPARLNRIVDMPAHALISDVTAYVAAAPQRRKVVIYIGPGIDLDGQWALRGADDVQGAVLAARRGNVNIYTINTSELIPRMETERTKMSRMASLRELADHTGGTAIIDLQRYPDGLDQLFRENGSYYMLGYRTSAADNDGRRHDIDVRVNGLQNLLVRARSAIMRGKPSTTEGGAPAIEPSKELAPDLQGLVPNLDVTFNANVLAYARPGGKAAVAVITELAEPVPSGMTRIVQQVDVRLIAYDERGSVSAQTAQRASIDTVPSLDGQVHYRVMTKWDLAPGPYKLRLVAQNPVTRKLSNIEFDMSVPDFGARAVSLSGVAVTALPDPAPVPTFGSIAPVLDKAPTISREFASDTILTADVRVYQGGAAPPEPATMEIALLDSDGAREFHRVDPVAPTKFDNKDRAADYHLDLALESFDLRPGEYLLTMQATVGSHHSPRRDIRFSVR